MLKRFHILLLLAGLLTGVLALASRDTVVSQGGTVRVEGRVETSGDRPVAGVWVSLIRRAAGVLTDADVLAALGGSDAVVRVQANHEGRFTADLPVGVYDIRAYETGFRSFANERPLRVDNGDVEAIRVDLEPTASISGRLNGIRDARNAVVVAYATEDEELPPRRVRFKGERFDVVGLEPGTYRLEVRVPGYVPAIVPGVSVVEGEYRDDLVVDLDRGRSVSGRVVSSDGEGAGEIDVLVRGTVGGIDVEQRSQSGDDGSFTVVGLPPGAYTVETRSRVHAPVTAQIRVGPGDLSDLTLTLDELGRVRGRIRGDTPAGLAVAVIPDSVDLTRHLETVALLTASVDDGAFSIAGVPEGAYYVVASAPGYLRTYFPGTPNPEAAAAITILNGETTTTDAFTLLRGSAVTGRMVARDTEQPVAGVVVEIVALDRRATATAVTDEDGRYRVTGLGAGRYLVKARADGYIAQFFPGVLKAEEATALQVDGVRDEKHVSLALPVRAPADFNEDGSVDVSDLERFVDRVKAGGVTSSLVFDPNGDGVVTYADFGTVVDRVRADGRMIDPPSVLNWRSADADPGKIRAALRGENLVPALGYVARVQYDPEVASFDRADARESLFKGGVLRVEEVGPGVLLVVVGATDGEAREGDGELASLVFVPKDDETGVRIRTDAVTALLDDARMASPVLPNPIRLVLPPETFRLQQNVPNPFNPETTIAYELPEAVQVKLAIFNLVGQRVRSLVDEFKTAGRYEVRWDGKDDFGRDVGSGVYFYGLEAGAFSTTRRMLLIR